MGHLTQIQLVRPGKFNSLQLVNAATAKAPQKGEVVIKVRFSGLNFADIMMRLGLYPDAPSAPFCPGYEVSGEIIEVSSHESRDLQVGDLVMAGCYFGGQASHVTVPSWQVQKLAPAFDLKLAAALPVSGLTCDLALGQLARVRTQDSVMIDCGSGALGSLMISYLLHLGCKEVIGLTSNKDKLSTIEARGAKAMLVEQWQHQNSIKVDVIINSRGGKSLGHDQDKLRPLGRIIALGASHMVAKGRLSYFNVLKEFLAMKKVSFIDLMHANQGVMGLNVLRLFEKPELLIESLQNVAGLAAQGVLIPQVDKVFKASEVEAAYDYLGQGQSRGKVLLEWEDL